MGAIELDANLDAACGELLRPTSIKCVSVTPTNRFLRENETTVAGIAYSCAFNNFSHFNRHFLQFGGVPPTEYRRRSIR